MRTPTLLLLAFLGLYAASCTKSVSLQVLQPAEMALPEHINVIATIDRSKPANGFINVLEGLFSGESIGQDRRGRERALEGLTYSLTRTPRFSVRGTDVVLEGANTAVNMAPALSWKEVESICKQYGADAVVAIEKYDTDNAVYTTTYSEKYKDKEGNERTRIRHRAHARINVTIGWRLYDPTLKIIHDEFSVNLSDEATATGDTEDIAKRNLPDLAYRTFELSNTVGKKYGERIAPVWVYVSRSFFSTGKGNYKTDMKQAAAYAKADNWEKAAAIWNRLVSTADQKTAGRAAHNMAVASERLGKLEIALEWAEKAYQDYGNKSSRNYIYVLQERINDQRLLEYQMKKGT